MERDHHEWAATAVREVLKRCMCAVALQLEGRVLQLRSELARRGVAR